MCESCSEVTATRARQRWRGARRVDLVVAIAIASDLCVFGGGQQQEQELVDTTTRARESYECHEHRRDDNGNAEWRTHLTQLRT